MRRVTRTATSADTPARPRSGLSDHPPGAALSLARGPDLGEAPRRAGADGAGRGASSISVSTPFLYKAAVDSLAGEQRDDAWLIWSMARSGLTVAYGVARLGAVAFNELRDAIFVRVGQRALRRLALETFTHIHRLSMRYHITRKTGGLSRIIERGVKGVDFLLRFMLFSIGPLILELTMVAVIFAMLFGWQYMAVVLVTITLYVWFTFTRHRMAGEAAPRDERSGHRRQPEGDRQPAELRDGQVFQRRDARGRRAMTARCGSMRRRRSRPACRCRFLNIGQSVTHHHRACARHGDGARWACRRVR